MKFKVEGKNYSYDDMIIEGGGLKVTESGAVTITNGSITIATFPPGTIVYAIDSVIEKGSGKQGATTAFIG